MKKPPKGGGKEVRGVDDKVGSGTLDCLDHAAAVMLHLGAMLSAGGEKLRITIERDPEAGRFTVKREVLS